MEEENKVTIPSNKEMVEIMNKRGYQLIRETADKQILVFGELKHDGNPIKPIVTYFASTNSYCFSAIINPGVIKLTTDMFSTLEDDKGFNELETYIKEAMTKLYKD